VEGNQMNTTPFELTGKKQNTRIMGTYIGLSHSGHLVATEVA